jgi:hypothetical protein
MFPAGGPGAGLALLRAALAVTLLLDAWAAPTIAAYAWLASVVAALVLAGVLTPILAVLGGLMVLAHSALSHPSLLQAAPQVACSVALALLGPGAYSVDAVRYGRRLIRAPRSRRDD